MSVPVPEVPSSATTHDYPDVSVLVVTWNSEDLVADCLDATLAQAGAGLTMEVLVRDNGSTDGTAATLRAYEDSVSLELGDVNLGYAEGANQLARRARGRFLLLLNPGVRMEGGCIAALRDHLEGGAGRAAAAAQLVDLDGQPIPFAHYESLTTRQILGMVRRMPPPLDFAANSDAPCVADGQVTDPVNLECPGTACVLLDRDFGWPRLFDSTFPQVLVGADLYRRMRSEAYSVQVVPGARALRVPSTHRAPVDRMQSELIVSLRRFVAPTWPIPSQVILAAGLLANAAVAGAHVRLSAHDKDAYRTSLAGTLGAFGLAGGAQPWLSTVPPPLTRLRQVWWRSKSNALRSSVRASGASRRAAFIAQARYQALVTGTELTMTVHPEAEIGPDVRVEMLGGSATITIGRHASVGRDCLLRVGRGGSFFMGEASRLGERSTTTVKGDFRLGPRSHLARMATVHCDNLIHFGWGAAASDRSTFLDSSHVFTGSGVMVHERPMVLGSIYVEPVVVCGVAVTVLHNVTIGQGAVVGAGSIVSRSLPPLSVSNGAPARVRTYLDPRDRSTHLPRRGESAPHLKAP